MKRHWLFTWRGLTQSVGVRFGLAVFFVQALAIVGTGVYAEQAMWNSFQRHDIVPVRRLRDSVLANYRVAGINGLEAYIKERVSERYTDDIVILLSDRDGRIMAGNLPQWPTHLLGNSDWSTGTLHVLGAKNPQYMGLLITRLDAGHRLLIGTAVIPEDRLIAAYSRTIAISIVAAILISFFIAWLASFMVARQLRGIIDVATKVADGDFSGRLKINGSGDRFDDLMHWINRTLNRLDTMVSELRLVSSGLAHDLRSPITRLRVTLERALSETKDPVSLTAMQKMMAETDTLLAMAAMTLQISNAEAGTSRDRFTDTNILSLLEDLAEIYGPLAEERGFKLSVHAQEDLSKLLHRELLGQALSNLIENALNYAEGGSYIQLSASREGDILHISVADNGVGIPSHREADARRRYGRLDSARQLPGSGLGLSLVEAVARLHGGRMILAGNAPGLVVTMALPVEIFKLR
jgi:signal transduction histidine kinase